MAELWNQDGNTNRREIPEAVYSASPKSLRLLFQLTCDFMLRLDLNTGTYEQTAFCDLGGGSVTSGGRYPEFFEDILCRYVEPPDVERVRQALSLAALRQKAGAGRQEQTISCQYHLKETRRFSWLESKAVVFEEKGAPIAYIITNDVTRQNNARELKYRCDALEKLWHEDERYRILLQQTDTIVFECALKNGGFFISPSAEEIFPIKFNGRCPLRAMIDDQIVHPEEAARLEQIIGEARAQRGLYDLTLRLRDKTGVYRWYKISVTQMAEQEDAGIRLLGSLTNVDAETRMHRDLQYRAEFDTVTGIYNKATFFQKTKALLLENPNEPHRILHIDIDKFKMVNDLFGVSEGDKVLHYIGGQLLRRTHEGETYGRMGDDVFCVCLARGDKESIRFFQELSEALNYYPLDFHFILSAGICRVQNYRGEPVNMLCDRANLAHKTVKGNLMKQYAFYEERMETELRRELDILSDVRRAVAEQQFIIYLQPKCDMNTGKVFGSEALVRWRHPAKGMIPPGDFIPLFEKNGFIITLDEYVWEQACRTLRSWIDRGMHPLPISVNISRVHLYNPNLCETILRLLDKYRLEPRLLELELTESAYTEDPQMLYRVMADLQSRGFTFLMDDFGSGYSSLNMLKDVPVDILKIDLNFLRNFQSDHSGRIILETTILMAQRLHLPVIAEGVETQEQAAFLRGAGCSQAQGFLYARPMPVRDFEEKFLL